MYIAFRYDLIQQLVEQIGTPVKQSVLLRKIIFLHSDTMRYIALAVHSISIRTSSIIIFSDSVELFLQHIR